MPEAPNPANLDRDRALPYFNPRDQPGSLDSRTVSAAHSLHRRELLYLVHFRSSFFLPPFCSPVPQRSGQSVDNNGGKLKQFRLDS